MLLKSKCSSISNFVFNLYYEVRAGGRRKPPDENNLASDVEISTAHALDREWAVEFGDAASRQPPNPIIRFENAMRPN